MSPEIPTSFISLSFLIFPTYTGFGVEVAFPRLFPVFFFVSFSLSTTPGTVKRVENESVVLSLSLCLLFVVTVPKHDRERELSRSIHSISVKSEIQREMCCVGRREQR